MDITQLAGEPEFRATIGGREYHFSELPLEQLAKLQTFINRIVPHPLEALKPHLEGLDPADRRQLLESARQEARDWPPKIGTAEGAQALLGIEEGQVEALYVGLSVHHPELSRNDALRIFRMLNKETLRLARKARREGRTYDGEGLPRRIFAVLFGMPDPDLQDEEDDGPLPKSSAGRIDVIPGSTGPYSFAAASGN